MYYQLGAAHFRDANNGLFSSQENSNGQSKLVKLLLISAKFLFICLGIGCLTASIILKNGQNNFELKIFTEKQSGQQRFPAQYRKISVDLFSNAVVQNAFQKAKFRFDEEKIERCFGPSDNIDIIIDAKADFPSHGRTLFTLDCREASGNSMVDFLLVISMEGEILAAFSPSPRAETIHMVDPETVMYASVGTGEAYLWKWRTNEHIQLPFLADSHSLIYEENENIYYGFLSKAEGGSPDTVLGWRGEDGAEMFRYEIDLPESATVHGNYLSLSGEFLYISLRDVSSLLKVNRRSGELCWKLGGQESDFKVIRSGEEMTEEDGNEEFYHWMGQHKFQIIDDQGQMKVFTLFNNNYQVGVGQSGSSQMMKLQVDEDSKTVEVIFVFDTHDKSMIYGGADLLPFGNLLGNSYPEAVDPNDLDHQYHVNIWELTEEGQVAWRVGIKGLNPMLKVLNSDEMYFKVQEARHLPTGWNIFMAERFYNEIPLGEVCVAERSDRGLLVRIEAYNTVRTQTNQRGSAKLYMITSVGNILLNKFDLDFRRSFGKSFAFVDIPSDYSETELVIEITNSWDEVNQYNLPENFYSSMSLCMN